MHHHPPGLYAHYSTDAHDDAFQGFDPCIASCTVNTLRLGRFNVLIRQAELPGEIIYGHTITSLLITLVGPTIMIIRSMVMEK